MAKRDALPEESAHDVDESQDRADKVNRHEHIPPMSDEEFGRFVFETPQTAMELLLNRAKECGVIDMAAVRAWGIEALASAPGGLDLPLLNLVLDRALGFTIEQGELVFDLDERISSVRH